MRMTKWQAGIAGMTAATAFSVTLAFGVVGCKSNSNQDQSQPAQVADLNNAPDPAAANEAPVSGTTGTTNSTGSSYSSSSGSSAGRTAVLSSSASAPQSQSGEQYQDQSNFDQQYASGNYDTDNDQSAPVEYAQQAPPPLPEYQQPELTEPGYIWTPGYWSWGSGGYYWVPGAWVAPPYQDALWTPGYWGYNSGRYGWHRGYWARHIGYYGGINYGFGYVGFGYQGGYWNGDRFYYNNAVNHVNVNDVHYVYQRNVPENSQWGRVSFNGPSGVRVAPRPAEIAVLREQRTPPMQVQQQRVQEAAQNRQQFFAENHGHPAIAVANQHFAADRTPPPAIQQHGVAPGQPQRGGFGQPGQQNAAMQQHNAAIQQQQRNGQVQQQQQAREQQQQHTEQLNQQHNAQVQQQQQAREQNQQRTQQLNQQHNAQVQQQQQAREQEQQRTQQLNQQRNTQVQQQQQAREQQQRQVQDQRQPQPRPQPQARPQEQQARPEPQARPQEQPRPAAPQPRPQAAPRPAPQPQHEAPHPQERPKA